MHTNMPKIYGNPKNPNPKIFSGYMPGFLEGS